MNSESKCYVMQTTLALSASLQRLVQMEKQFARGGRQEAPGHFQRVGGAPQSGMWMATGGGTGRLRDWSEV